MFQHHESDHGVARGGAQDPLVDSRWSTVCSCRRSSSRSSAACQPAAHAAPIMSRAGSCRSTPVPSPSGSRSTDQPPLPIISLWERDLFRVVRRLGFGVKITPNRIGICASRRIRRYMIVLGFDDPRNSDLSTQRHNGRWPMAPWRQWHARVRRRRAAARARMKPARLSPAPYMPGPTPDVPWDPPTSAGRPARTELICLVMRTRGSLTAGSPPRPSLSPRPCMLN